MTTNDLRPCPFCGEAVEIQLHENEWQGITYVLRNGCGAIASFRLAHDPENTVASWNARVAGSH